MRLGKTHKELAIRHFPAPAAELDELPLPYRYDVKPFDTITLRLLREHIERVGIPLFPEPTPP